MFYTNLKFTEILKRGFCPANSNLVFLLLVRVNSPVDKSYNKSVKARIKLIKFLIR